MTRKRDSQMRFSFIEIENWKNFAKVKVPLQKRVFIVGPNASGKSNLLYFFRFLRDLATPGGGFQEAIRIQGGVKAIRCLAARRYPEIKIRVVVESSSGRPEWEYTLHFSQDNQRRPLIRKETVRYDGELLVDRPDDDDREDPERLTQTYLEQVNVNRRFRDLVSFFQSVRYIHVYPQLVREPDRSVGRNNDPFGGDFLEQIAKTRGNTQKARLRRIRDALCVAVPQLQEIELWRDHRGTPHLRGKYEHWRAKGAWKTEEQLSDGTLRLIGILWATMEKNGPLLLEEPELSLHPEVVRYLPQMFARVVRRSGRQIILSTHSPELLRDEGIGLDEVLLLCPSSEGTEVRLAKDFEEIRHILAGGVTLGEAIIPHTRPEKAEQLPLFGDL